MKTKNVPLLFMLFILTLVGCEIEPYGSDAPKELIGQETQLYSYLQLASNEPEATLLDVGCIEFLYPFVLFVYDGNEAFVRKESILDNKGFTDVLSNLEEGHAISLSYPIMGNLEDGTQLKVTNNEELEASLNSCIEAEMELIIGECDAIAQECLWKVAESSIADSQYLESEFDMQDDGGILLTALENEYEGTWVFYFIYDELHLNMFYEYNDDNRPTIANELPLVKDDWNYDWKIITIDEEKIEISNANEITYTLERFCPEEDEEVVTEN